MPRKPKGMDNMTSAIVLQQNELILAHYNLSLVEMRLVLLAIAQAKQEGITVTHETLLEVRANEYAQQYGVSLNNAYTQLKQASKQLFNRYITHVEIDLSHKPINFQVRWVDKIGYQQDEGFIYLRFTKELAPLISEIDGNFTYYNLEDVSNMSSFYSIRLYQLIMQWKTKGKTPVYSLEEFRGFMGLDTTQYNNLSDFKKYVLDFAVSQINTHSPYEMYNPEPVQINKKTGKPKKQFPYIQIKESRTITGFQFYFRKKKSNEDKKIIEGEFKDITGKSPQRDPTTIDLFTGKTDRESPNKVTLLNQKQADMFAPKLCNNSNFGGRYAGVGEDMQPFIQRVSNELQRDMSKLALYMPYLLKAGYAPTPTTFN